MNQRRRIVRVVAIQGFLLAAVRVHREQPLRVDLAAVVVVPAGVDYSSIGKHAGILCRHLVESEPQNVAAIQVARIQIHHIDRLVAIDDVHTTRRVVENAIAGKIASLYVGYACFAGHLPKLLRGHGHFVDVVVVLKTRLLPGEEDSLAVVRYVEIANHAFWIAKQVFNRRFAIVIESDHANGRPLLEWLAAIRAIAERHVQTRRVSKFGVFQKDDRRHRFD